MGSLFRKLPREQAAVPANLPQWKAISRMPPGREPWFDPKIEGHRRLTTYPEDDPQVSIEFQNVELLTELIMEHQRLEQNSGRRQEMNADFVVLRSEGSPFDAKQADRLASVLHHSRHRKLLLLVSTFQPGSLRRLADGLNRSLEMIGLAWLFSVANIGDEASIPKEIAYLAEKTEIERLAILTARLSSEVEQKLAQALKSVTSLKVARVCQRDEAGQLPLFRTPALDAALATH